VHRLGINGHGLHESANNRRHRPRPAQKTVVCAHLAKNIGQRHATLTKAYMDQPWPARIGWATSSVACAHRPMTGDIGEGLHASTMACAHRLGDIG